MVPRALALCAAVLLSSGCTRIGYSSLPAPAPGVDAGSDGSPSEDGAPQRDGPVDGAPITDGSAGPLIVEPTYPNAPGILEHVRRDAPSSPHYAQLGEACDPDVDTKIGACVHAGIQRKAKTNMPSCDGLEGRDTLRALQWTCDARSGQAVFYATGLASHGGLALLLEADRFKPMALEVLEQGKVVAASAPGVWWSNPVRPLPPSTGEVAVALTETGTIYTVAQDTDSAGHNIEADSIAVVVLPGASLAMSEGAPNASLSTGERASADHRCLLAAGSQHFLWIEGELRNVANGLFGVHVMHSSYVTFRRLRVDSFKQIGISLQRSQTCRFHHVVANNNGHYGIVVATLASNHVLREVTVAGNGTVDGPGFFGLFIQHATDNVITRLTAVHNRPYGAALMTGASATTIGYATFAANSFAGLQAAGDGSHTVFHAVAVKNGQHGIRLNAPGSQLAQSAAGHQARGFSGEPGVAVSGELVVAENGSHCQFGGVTACASLGTVTVREENGLLDAFMGRVESDDAVNISDDGGGAPRAEITDWVSFVSRRRAWGGEGALVPLGVCEADCRIWDWRLVHGDAKLALVSGAGTVSTGEACPAAISGDETLTDESGNTFLVNALELLGDGLGDEDGLCESNEGCAYMPHAGDDQLGWLPGAERCVFKDGTIRGVQMVAWVYGGS